MIDGVRNSLPAFAGSPLGSANKRVSGFGLRLCPNPSLSLGLQIPGKRYVQLCPKRN